MVGRTGAVRPRLCHGLISALPGANANRNSAGHAGPRCGARGPACWARCPTYWF